LGTSRRHRFPTRTATWRWPPTAAFARALKAEGYGVALAAHRTTAFRGLQQIRIGDVITITTPNGSFCYVVKETFVVNPEDTYVLDPTGEKTLTLVTCYPFDYRGSAPYRFIVRAQARTS
jgi:sortase A